MAAASITLSRTRQGIRVDGPDGPVHLTREGLAIRATYRGERLVNGSALAYAHGLKGEALAQAEAAPAPWSPRRDGGLAIRDQAQFYRDLFDPAAAARDRLRFWLLDGAR
ncbi:MAG: hypothetical protein ACFE0O_10455 [Opitutales bacterium]